MYKKGCKPFSSMEAKLVFSTKIATRYTIRHISFYVYTVMFCIRFWQNKLVKGVNIPFLGGITRIADAAAGFVCAEYGPLSIPHLLS